MNAKWKVIGIEEFCHEILKRVIESGDRFLCNSSTCGSSTTNLVRPLFRYDSVQEQLWNVDDAFFLGDALLVCPVVDKGARMRHIILPKGHWYNFWDDILKQGGRQTALDAPLEKIPLLVKAGSIVPMESGQQLILHLYPPVKKTRGAGDAGGREFNPKSKI